MNQGVFLAGLSLAIFSFHRGKFSFYNETSISRFTKHICLDFKAFERYTQDTMYHSVRKDARGQCSVRIDCHTGGYSDQVILYCQITPRKTWEAAYCCQKTQILDESCCCNEEKNDPLCFSGRYMAANIQLSKRESTDFTISIL